MGVVQGDAFALGPLPEGGKRLGAEAAYAEQVERVMAAAEWPWPKHVLTDPTKRPRFVGSVEEFLHALQYGCHMDEVVVFPGGLQALGQQDVLYPPFRAALGIEEGADKALRARSAYEVLERLAATGVLERLKGKVMFHLPDRGDQKGKSAGGGGNSCLAGKWEAVQEDCPEVSRSNVYIAEVRQLHPQPTEGGLRRTRKSTLSRTMRERVHELGTDVHKMLFWDDYSEGLFVGGHNSGYDLHVDCIPSSNVGSVFSGHKLLAIWSHGSSTRRVMREHRRELFVPPLVPSQVAALEEACCVAMAPPGSIYVFSGTNAHTVCNVGFTAAALESGPGPEPCLIVSSYEAFVGVHPRHAEVLLEACDDYDPDSDEDMRDFEEEIGVAAGRILQRTRGGCPADGGPSPASGASASDSGSAGGGDAGSGGSGGSGCSGSGSEGSGDAEEAEEGEDDEDVSIARETAKLVLGHNPRMREAAEKEVGVVRVSSPSRRSRRKRRKVSKFSFAPAE